MKPPVLLILILSFSSIFAQEKSNSVENHFGLSVNSSYLTGLETISVGPSIFYYRESHQFELGFGCHPVDVKFQYKYGGEFLYKYFMDGIDKRVNPFFVSSLTITRNNRFQSMWSGDYRRKEINAAALVGLGIQIKLFERAFIGASLSFGTSTYKVDAVNDDYSSPMFKYYNLERAARINIGFRF